MAASGGSIEWSTTVKPILTALYGPFFDKNDAVEIIQAIIKRENEFQTHDDANDLFYTCFACLSAHFISINANNLPADQLSTARDAFRIILEQILKKLSEAGLSYEDSTNTAAPNVSVKQLLLPIVGLCGIDGGGLPQSDLVILTSLLKSAKLPANNNTSETQATKSSVIPSPITSLSSQTTTTEKQAPSNAQRRSDALLEQLTMPLRNPVSSTAQAQPVPGVMTPGNKDSMESAKDGNSSQQASVDMKKWVASTCASLLMELRAGSVVLKVCSSLPCLQRYLSRWQNAKESAMAPQFNSDVTLLHFLVNEVHVCRLALSLPCLEPFTPERIAALSDVATAWLLCCATAQASLHPKDEESEQQTATLVESALSLYNTVGETFKQSTRAGGYVYQNHLMIGAWVLLCGLHHALAGAPGPAAPNSPAKPPSRPYNLTKMQQGLSVVWVALGGRCLAWTGALLSDARMEAMSTTNINTLPSAIPAPLQILAHHTAHQRELRLASAAPLHQLLVALGVVCYRKATHLKRAVQKQHPDADPDRSDSTVYFQDMILCSEDSETDDEDSEPLFGLWFESTLVAPDALDSGLTRAGANDNNDSNDTHTRPNQAIVPDKAEPYSYITLATEVFNLLTEEIISEDSERLGPAAMQLHEAHTALLAALAKDLDRETARTDTGTISPCFGARLGSLYASFSSALVRYLHNLSGSPAFASLQPALQQQLLASGSERNNTSSYSSPLQVGPRVVKLLGSMVLSKAAADRENSILVMWHKIVNTLQECALQSQPSQDHDYEDLNVEHAQLLVYLFHSLTLMQKKSVLLLTANAIIKVVDILGMTDRKHAMNLLPHQLMLTTRLMLLLEYLMKHLYDAPQTLLQQIEWNLVIAPGLAQPPPDPNNIGVKTTTDSGQIKSRIYCDVPYIEDAYRRSSQDETSMRPKFYALTNAEVNNQENPKLDGLACNFVLGTPHKLKYPLLLDALLALLNSACLCDNPQYSSSSAALSAAHYCFQTAWRLVISMPPATPHMDKLQAGIAADLPSPLPLHALIWAPRADNKKVFNPWLKDALVKQGMYTQYAENLLAGVSASCDNIKYTAWLASETIKHLKQNINANRLPSLIDVISCDAALVRLRLCLVESSSASEAHQFMPDLLELLETILDCCRLSASMELDMEGSANASDSAVATVQLQVCATMGPALAVSSDDAPPVLGTWLKAQLPDNVATVISVFSPPPLACVDQSFYANHIIPSESVVLSLINSHCDLMSNMRRYYIGPSLMMLAYSASKLLEAGSSKLADSPTLTKKTLDLIVPALTDGRLEFLVDPLSDTIVALVPQSNKAEQLIHEHILKTTYTVLVDHLQPSTQRILRQIVKYWEKILDRPAGRLAYENVFADNSGYKLGKILLSAPNAKNPYTERVIKLFIKIFSGCESSELNSALCVSVCKFIGVADQQKLHNLLAHICLVTPATSVNGNVGSASGSPTEAELPTPTSSAPEAGGNPASLALRNALRSVFRTDNETRNDNANRNEQDLPVFDAPSPAPRAQSETAQPSGNSSKETCSWSDGSKDSGAAPPAAVDNVNTAVAVTSNDNANLLTLLCKHIVHHGGEKVCERMVGALISVSGDTCTPLLLRELCRLADANAGSDHRHLFPAALNWLSTCVENLSSPDVLEKLEEGQLDTNLTSQIESACVLLSYLADALHAIGTAQPHTWRSVSPTWESPSDLGFEFDYTDEQQDDDDTSADDSDEDAMLQYRLCTFTVTQREFMNQHWYHCHTCKMVDGVGVCTVCARVCHRGHDVSYAKFGNFFCDCGAKPDSSCQALVKRSVTLGGVRGATGGSEETPPAPSIRRRPSSPTPPALLALPRRPVLAHNIQGCRSFLLSYNNWGPCLERVRRLLAALAGPVRAACERGAAVGAHGRAQRALAQLHLGEKRFTHTDSLMLPTLGSQEGAFENVRMSYTGENGQTIRQLMSAHKLRRVAMCCLASPQGRRQHLAVSHEKGKITVLQLSALLKQADSSKHKLTLTRLSSAPIPFTVLSLSGNPWNEDLLAVCGLKECHVLTFNSGGAVADHLVLNAALEANNYVIKAIWLPGSQTQLALVTSDFVKIFDLSKDLNNPMHYFLVPSGKVRDVTFVNQEDVMHMLCMSSAGHIYWQPMTEESRATLGTFYVTNTLEVLHPEIQDVAGLVGSGGVSIYYSHTLKMLFFSYAQGKSFLAPLNTVEDSVKGTAMITLSSTAAQKEGGRGKQGVQSLCQWAEVPGHPGLVTAVMQASNNPVVLMLTPNNIQVQEIKVVLMLAGDLDSSVEGDRAVLERLLEVLVAELDIQPEEATSGETPEQQLQLVIMRLEHLTTELDVYERTNRKELQLVIMRLLSVLMARWKTCGAGAGSSGNAVARGEASGAACAAHVSRMAAAALVRAQAPKHCYNVLAALLPYWKEKTASTGTTTTGQQLLKPQPPQPLPDMQPFFVKEYVKSHALDVFDNYPQLVMEMALRLPCQIHKHCDPKHFDARWRTLLCEYMMNQQTPLRKQVRKLLLLLCGTRERYRQLRDVHALDTHLNAARALLGTDPAYDKLVRLMDHLKACAEIVSARTGNWQHTCCSERRETLGWLVKSARRLHPHVAPTVLQLLQAALCAPSPAPPAPAPSAASATPAAPATAAPAAQKAIQDKNSSEWPERERSAESDAFVSDGSKFQEQRVPQLVQQILKQVSQEELNLFVKAFLLETNSTAVRWQAHALLLAIYNNCSQAEQASLVSLLWGLWPTLPQYGRKAAQFVDLLGYFTLKTPDIDTENYIGSAVELLRNQNQLLSSHGNAALYAALGAYVELDGYYLESDPCLVCNNPEVPMATIKLPTIKIDSKFTTTTQIVKLVNSHMISRISLRIGDIKRSKMVRTINFYYNNRTVQAVQELKNKPGMWHKAKRVQLQSGQSEVRVDFPLPIVACNLMMEYADFYENQQATGESLQCPRCSQSVPANPGVCANCGENVFQCHKCRAINYDEKDPFLCHACGFCKYAKFDYTLTARPCCAVDTIENDEERKKMVQTIGALLDKADRVYRQLIANKPVLESLVHKISEHRVEGRPDENSNGAGGAFGGAQINRVIQTLAHKYCVESKGHFEDLSKIIQKVLACRKELVAYDRSQSEQLKGDTLPVYAGLLQNYDGDVTKESGGACYGCSLACAEQCLTLLRALASQREHRARLCRFGLVHELVHHNLHRGTPQCQEEVRSLICLVTRDNLPETEHLCNLLSQRITLSLMGHAASQDHNNSVRPLVLLLGSLVKVQDSIECWEVRLRCTVKLWVWCCPQLTEVVGIPPAAQAILKPEALAGIPGINTSSPNSHQFALQQVALPCLRYMQELMAADTPEVTAPAPFAAPGTEEQPKDAKQETPPPTPPAPTVLRSTTGNMVVDLSAWLAGTVPHKQWRKLVSKSEIPPADTTLPPRDLHLAHKYVGKWKEKMLLSNGMRLLALDEGGWLRPVMFDPSSRIARYTACQMVKSLCDSYERTKAVLILLTSFLPEVGAAGEASEQFLELYESLASKAPWKQFLALRGVLQQIADLMTKEIDQLHHLEETTLTSDLAQGYAMKRLTELLAMFLEDVPGARRAYKGRLVGAVLGGYLSLRRLVVQRTRLTDDTQEKLLELLEEMTTGTEAETAEFMAVCIETVQKYPLHDYRTPVFIFERLCSIIYPEENDVGEFFLTLEKDPQQEDFLQGRMLGNPYSSLEPGMGPLMRDVKNKICTDCELVALLEDDNGMELLVCNKIMSLDLPVKDVYKKVWCTSGEGVDAMRVVYRMRGLLGDATEEFVETLSQTNAETVDDEQVYRMANVLADCGGLEVMLQRLAAIGRVGCARALAGTLLRLLSLCARVRRCVRVLTQPSARALPVLLHALSLAAADEKEMQRAPLVYQLLEIMERILSVASSESLESFLQFSLTFGGPEHVQALLNCTECPGIRNNSVALGHLTRVLAALVYGNDLKMAMLVDHFKPVLDFDRLDSEQWTEEEFRMELFCVLCANIERNSIGGTLKDYLISLGVVRDALEYIVKHAPCVKPTLVCTDSDELKEFISRPALKYILRFLTGLAADHEPTQMLVCEKVIPIVHRLEQVSSGEHVGSLAENLLEALRSQPQCAAKVQQVRDFTRQEKKRLAMAVRERQLGALGMRSNERGQVTAQCSLTQQVADLAEEAGAVCCICREGYKYQPTKVLGIYTFTKRCPVEEFEVRARKTLGYTTVSHYNVVHVECHMAAVRLARARDEWESAALQNASTRCNGLLPLWGPHVPESAFASCLARHTTYLQECTGHRDIGHSCTVHDLKLLLLRFARERTFHDDTGGGGPLSNMQLVPALAHMALYVINTTRVAAREVTALEASLAWAAPRVLESAHDAEGPLYFLTLMLLLYPPAKWRSLRLEMLGRLLIIAHVRAVAPGGPAMRALPAEHRAPRPWADYKPYAVFVALIHQLYTVMFKNVVTTPTITVEQWPIKLAGYIRYNDEANAKAAERIVVCLFEELLPCASFAEFCDAAAFLEDIPDPDAYLQNLIEQLP